MRNANKLAMNENEQFVSSSFRGVKDSGRFTTATSKYTHLSSQHLTSLKSELISSIQAVSLQLGELLQERHALREEVAGRHVTIAQLLRVQEARASQLGLQPAVQMSPAPRR